MEKTLIVSERKSSLLPIREMAEKAFGPSVILEASQSSFPFDSCSPVLLIFCVEHSSLCGEVTGFLSRFSQLLSGKRTGIICVAENEVEAETALHNAEKFFIRKDMLTVGLTFDTLSGKDYGKANIAFNRILEIKRQLKDTAEMPVEQTTEAIRQILQSHNTCTLCTGYGSHIRATPIEYLYINECLYFISEGGEKFIGLRFNPNASVAIYNPYSGFNALEGLQIEGTAEMIETFSDEYLEVMKKRGITEEKARSLPAQLNMFKVIPKRFEILKSEFAKNGFQAKQVLISKENIT